MSNLEEYDMRVSQKLAEDSESSWDTFGNNGWLIDDNNGQNFNFANVNNLADVIIGNINPNSKVYYFILLQID